MTIVYYSERCCLSAFKRYSPGGPTCRLYVKNLARQVDEEVSCHLSSGFFTPKPCLVLLSFEA